MQGAKRLPVSRCVDSTWLANRFSLDLNSINVDVSLAEPWNQSCVWAQDGQRWLKFREEKYNNRVAEKANWDHLYFHFIKSRYRHNFETKNLVVTWVPSERILCGHILKIKSESSRLVCVHLWIQIRIRGREMHMLETQVISDSAKK